MLSLDHEAWLSCRQPVAVGQHASPCTQNRPCQGTLGRSLLPSGLGCEVPGPLESWLSSYDPRDLIDHK